MKFKPGDLVWVRSSGPPRDGLPVGEYPGQVSTIYQGPLQSLVNCPIYIVNVPEKLPWVCAETVLRPRRDDYQQHESLGSMDKILEPWDEARVEMARYFASKHPWKLL